MTKKTTKSCSLTGSSRKLEPRLGEWSRFKLPFWLGGLITASIVILIESIRQAGGVPPIPFLLLMSSTILAANWWGIRGGLLSAAVMSVYIAYATLSSFGPVTLTGGPIRASLGIMASFGVAAWLGRTRDQNKVLTKSLRSAKEELEKQVRELATLNKELETFSYTVSHDLRNPITVLKGVSSLWLKSPRHQLDEKEKEYLELIYHSSSHMEQIVQDLLILSQVKQSEIKIQPVDLSALVGKIVPQLQQQQPERQVEWIISPQVMAQGDSHLLSIALENLLNNAWKYTSQREKAWIKFGVMSAKGRESLPPRPRKINKNQCIYFVQDNGVGFEPQQADQLFIPFHRLENARSFEGTGIGLATVQRIIHRHGGSIWVEAAVNQGATFYFTLDSK